MDIQHVLAVLPVTDIEAAAQWYGRFFGVSPTNNPMGSLYEWRITGAGWIQVFADAGSAGSAMVNFAVDDLEAAIDELAGRGLTPGSIVDADKGVRLSALTDPDGNTIRLIGGFREVY
ncbi:VOC family protein [Mycobacterium sp. 1423905.2]|uniref:VOC family protein n=1 Tax=Mycobacterium sp. 1423905.2 TaxID=1856859 RepID=UPI0008002302|nr:VOC family protein [Mycobacterium sp. 1423905.2]OBJ54862.1 glyoxalase [Mycobacterium sp. 1423905.2]